MSTDDTIVPARGFIASIRTARSAAIAGMIFAVTLVVTLYLFRSAFPFDDYVAPTTLTPEAMNQGRWALTLLPYAGIAFLWFMAALNYNLGHADHRLFTTVFVASGVIFVALLFVAGAFATAELAAVSDGMDLTAQDRFTSEAIIHSLLVSYCARMAAVFCLAVSTFGRLRKLLPTWLSLLGTVAGLVLLLVPLGVHFVEFIFPAWVAVLSVWLFVADPGGKAIARQSSED